MARSKEFCCPGCGSVYEKDDALLVISEDQSTLYETHDGKKAELSEAVHCRFCGFEMPTRNIIAGRYDISTPYALYFVVVLLLSAFLIWQFSDLMHFAISILCAVVVTFVVAWFVSLGQKAVIRSRK